MNMRFLMSKKVSITTGLSALVGGTHFSTAACADPAAVATFDLLVIGGGSGGIACGKYIIKNYYCLLYAMSQHEIILHLSLQC